MLGFRQTLVTAFLISALSSFASAQNAPSEDYQQRMTNALTTAKKSADELNSQSKSLQDAINKAADPQQARKFLDDLIASSSTALQTFGENGEMMSAVTGLLSYIEERKKNAERESANDPRWITRVDSWKAHGDNIRQLRQEILKEADRAQGLLGQLKKDRSYIEDVIAGEGVAKAKIEMEAALKNLQNLGDSLSEAVRLAEDRNKKLKAPAF